MKQDLSALWKMIVDRTMSRRRALLLASQQERERKREREREREKERERKRDLKDPIAKHQSKVSL